MSSGTRKKAAGFDDNEHLIEMEHLVDACNDLERGDIVRTGAKIVAIPEGLFHRLMLKLDEGWNLKNLCRLLGPRFEFTVRLMLVSTFIDDSIRVLMHFSEHMEQIVEQGCLKWLSEPSFAFFIAAVLLGIGLLAQSIGSFCLLARVELDGATKVLIGWVIVQPVLYLQLWNFGFLAESLSLIGGLLMLRSHLVLDQAEYVVARMQLISRLLLPSMYLYYAGKFLISAITLDETNNFAAFVLSLSMFLFSIAALVGLVIGSMLVSIGLKSRFVALSLALINLGFVFYQYPFFRFVYLCGGQWKIRDDIPMPHVSLPEDVYPGDWDLLQIRWQIYDLYRYYFFLGLSNSGALMLLAQFGPGEIAVQKDEIMIPTRAID
eukprot:scaffold197_cov268-Chaetoceros_neogracile.AAC.54